MVVGALLLAIVGLLLSSHRLFVAAFLVFIIATVVYFGQGGVLA